MAAQIIGQPFHYKYIFNRLPIVATVSTVIIVKTMYSLFYLVHI